MEIKFCPTVQTNRSKYLWTDYCKGLHSQWTYNITLSQALSRCQYILLIKLFPVSKCSCEMFGIIQATDTTQLYYKKRSYQKERKKKKRCDSWGTSSFLKNSSLTEAKKAFTHLLINTVKKLRTD